MRQLLLTLHLGFQGLLQLPVAGRLLLSATCACVGPQDAFGDVGLWLCPAALSSVVTGCGRRMKAGSRLAV